MIDQVLIQIPFSSSWVECSVDDFEKNAPDPFSRDFACSIDPKYIPVSKGAKTIFWCDEISAWKQEEIYCPWESIPSSHSGLAIKVYHTGNGFCNWPYIEIKCSPAKLIQGHNIYGFDDLGKSVKNMIWLLNQKYPEFLGGYLVLEEKGGLLDLDNARIGEIDLTYSIQVPDEIIRLSIIDYIASISKGQTKARGDNYESTAYFGSRKTRLKKIKVYDKRLETIEDNKQRKRSRKPLMNDEILNQADGLLRFEATGKREWFDRRAIPTNMIKMCEWFAADKSSYISIFTELTKDLFASFEGQTVIIMNENEIFKKIEESVGSTRGKASRIFGTYQSIKAIGLNRFKLQYLGADNKPTKTYYRLLKELENCGFSRASICNLHKDNQVIVRLPRIVNLGSLIEPVPFNHKFVDLWDQVA